MSISNFRKSEARFSFPLYHVSSIFLFGSRPPPTSLSIPFTPHLILLSHSFSVHPHLLFPISCFLLLLCGTSLALWERAGLQDGGFDAWERRRGIGDHGCETASVCRLRVRHIKSLHLSPELPLLRKQQEWDVERKGM